MKTRFLTSTLAGLVLLTSCGPIRFPGENNDPAPAAVAADDIETPVEPETPEPARGVELKQSEIDWNSARRDFASQPLSTDENTVSVAAASSTPVPVLLPQTPVVAASSDGAPAMDFRPTADGYYAVLRGEDYDMIITGTDRLTAAPGRGQTATDTELRFEETMTGAQVAFSRYGASYLVDFACKTNAAVTGDGCVTETNAKAAVEDLLIAGTQ